jgi:hypothetical protein
MRLLGLAPHVGMAAAQEQAAWRANARANEAQVRGGIEQARIPLLPSWQQALDLCA